MASCNICLENFRQPVSLPCGHIFCTECVVKSVQAVRPVRNVHPCPMCRAPYNIAPLNPLVVPPHLRPFITPTIRRVYIDSPENAGDSSSSASIPPNVAEELAKLRTETQTLRSHCMLWRRRAELHGAATLGLLDFARMVRDQAASLARERDQFKQECQSLKRKLEDYDQASHHDFKFPFDQAMSLSFHPHGPYLTSTSPLFSPTSPSCLSPCPSVEASRLEVPTLFDLHSYMNQPPNVPSPLPADSQTLDFDIYSRHPLNIPGPSRPSFDSGPATPSSSTRSSPSRASSPSGSLSGDSTSMMAANTQANLDQPPKKRLRRDSGSAAGPMAEVEQRIQRRRAHGATRGQVALEALAQASVQQQRVAAGGASVAGSSSRS